LGKSGHAKKFGELIVDAEDRPAQWKRLCSEMEKHPRLNANQWLLSTAGICSYVKSEASAINSVLENVLCCESDSNNSESEADESDSEWDE
jgi:hypothetical protein